MKRRDFLTKSAALAAIAMTPLAPLAMAIGPETAQPAGPGLSKALFTPLIGQSFTLTDASGRRLGLRLKRLDANTSVSTGVEQFRLTFTKTSAAIPSGIYLIEHPRTGSHKLYLQPAGDQLQADFCLLT